MESGNGTECETLEQLPDETESQDDQTEATPESENADTDAGDKEQEQHRDVATLDHSSIIEMEVDDSNTGDTITSNPEIDLGSAAAAATAVIVEENEIDKPEDIAISIETTSSLDQGNEATETEEDMLNLDSAASPDDDVPKIISVSSQGQRHFDEQLVFFKEKSAEPALNFTEEYSDKTTLEYVADENNSNEKENEIEEMDVSESNSLGAEQTVFDNEDNSGNEVDQDYNDQIEQESDSALEMDNDNDQGFLLHEEESMQFLHDDLDKENNGDGDLVCDNDDDDDSFLEITRRRISQERDGNCYCGKDRNLNIAELLCASCYRWFHESCISYQLGKLVPFTTNYVFMCKNCCPSGLESFKRSQAQFTQMCVTALANLTQASVKEGTNVKQFSKDKDIIPFFEMHWEALTTTTRRSTQSWHSTVTKTLLKDVNIVYTCHEDPENDSAPFFGLISDDLTQIRPNYEAMIKGGQLKVTDLCNASSRGRGTKRRTITDPSIPLQTTTLKKPAMGPRPVVGHGYPTEHPFNKDSYRYILAEPDPNAPFRQEFDESNEWSGKPIHGWLCRVVNPPQVLLALHDRAPQLRVSEDRLSVTGEKGYCMIRATHGVTRGSWYFEARITDMPEGSATRIGFSQQFGNLQGPLGFDRYGYSWRSRYGTTFHEARGRSYAKGGYGLDDVLGFLIVLPESKNIPIVPISFKDRPLVKVKSHLYYEDKDDLKELNKREIREGSQILCFKNGVYQGVAFQDLFCGTYYPAISLYKGITVNCNFGPNFWAPPSPSFEYRGMCERVESSTIDQTMADLLYLTDNDGRLRLENAVPMPL